jgi:hypothetical protein
MSAKNNLFYDEENNVIVSTYTHTLRHSSTADSPTLQQANTYHNKGLPSTLQLLVKLYLLNT